MIGDEALNDEIRRLVEEGWILTSQSDNTAGMSRDGLAIFLELQTDGPVRISGTGKNFVIDGTPALRWGEVSAEPPVVVIEKKNRGCFFGIGVAVVVIILAVLVLAAVAQLVQ